MRFNTTAVGEGLAPPAETAQHFVRGTTVLYSLPPGGRGTAKRWKEPARVTNSANYRSNALININVRSTSSLREIAFDTKAFYANSYFFYLSAIASIKPLDYEVNPI